MTESKQNHHPRPIIGVLVNKKFFSSDKGALFASKLLQANTKGHCLIYFFTPGDIDWNSRHIHGYVPGPGNQWVRDSFPLPDFLYDRIVPFSSVEKAILEDIRERLRALPNLQFYNSCNLEKWKLHRALARYRAVNKYLPATILLRSFADIAAMLAQYGLIFIKKSDGRGGRSVFSVERQEEGFCLRFYRRGHLKKVVADINELQSLLQQLIDPEQEYVIQQGVRLMRFRGRLFDLRILLVKDKHGKWNAIYNQARLAQKGAVITNLALGGDVFDYSTLYPELKACYLSVPTDEEIRKAAIIIARHIEKGFGLFGEIGMDLGIDEDGKLWFFEGNSKPSKLPEQAIEDTVGISPQFLMTLQYARTLYNRRFGRRPITSRRDGRNNYIPAR